ncbi:hypothetical protein [Tsukamurella pseudospumae]|uniref:Uncharacterized protein n=1 Tax=Tsukamurella pseudospumae TaxID=239498 RepID=A0A138A8F1_9ACTN|nr:hypothetical protein [Tsukamurella pseudospumae]KXP06726.1 hypothetical protein AXK60_11725 [Tsukamurella pseudospumae]
MTTPFDPPANEPLTLAELDETSSATAPADPERLPSIPDDHPGWGNPRGELWGQVGIAHACLAVLWPAVAAADEAEDGPEVRADLARTYEADYGMSLPTAFARAAEYRGPRTELLHARAVALTNAADAGTAALNGSDDQAVITALSELHRCIDGAAGNAPDEEN